MKLELVNVLYSQSGIKLNGCWLIGFFEKIHSYFRGGFNSGG